MGPSAGWRLALSLLLLPAAPAPLAAAEAPPVQGRDVLEVFVRDGCPHCADAKEYLPQFSRDRPWLRIVYRSIDDDAAALDDLARHSRDAGIWPPGVPTFVFDGRVRLRDRGRMALIAGTFLLVSGAVHYAFMAAWLNVFLAVGMSTPLRVTPGGAALVIGAINAKDFLRPSEDFSLAIPAAAKPGIYARVRALMRAGTLAPALAAVIALAIVANFVELLCTAGLPAMFTAILTQHDLAPSAHCAYLGLRVVAYMADDSLMVATAVVALSSRKLTEHAGRGLKLASGAVMLALGALMLLRPDRLP